MSEIEFRLERTPVEESDDEVQHDDVPTGRCIAPILDTKLKNYKAMEGVPVTFSCKVVGIPSPKVRGQPCAAWSVTLILIMLSSTPSVSQKVYWFKDGKQVLRKNVHYKKIRERDGTCALHIETTTQDDDGNYTFMASNPQVIFHTSCLCSQQFPSSCTSWCLIFNDQQGRTSCSGHLIVQSGPPRNRMTPVSSQRWAVCSVRCRGKKTCSMRNQPRSDLTSW